VVTRTTATTARVSPLATITPHTLQVLLIHRWTDNTLQTLLAEYLLPELHQFEGALHDLMAARNQVDREAPARAEDS